MQNIMSDLINMENISIKIYAINDKKYKHTILCFFVFLYIFQFPKP
jgi:hypothetical protein